MTKTVWSPLQIVWFKRDLRVSDHRPLAMAAAQGPVLPLFVVEPAFWRQADMSARQWAFVRECLAELSDSLARLGQPLIIRTGDVAEVLQDLHESHGVAALWSHEETGNAWTYMRDKRIAGWARLNAVPWHEVRQTGVIRGLKDRNGWAARWDRFMTERAVSPPTALKPIPGLAAGSIPSVADLGLHLDVCPGRQRGGRTTGLDWLNGFLTTRGEPYRKAMSSPLAAFQGCSRISPYLAWGAMSMREVAHVTWARQTALADMPRGTAGGWRGAMRSFSGRLHWHCHFMQKLEDEPRLEFENLHPAYDGLRPAQPEKNTLTAWRDGETGLPFVDACMRALTATGWLNFRMRAMLMAVASYHLWLDWRAPGEHLARLFTDYEPGIHWPQVQMQSGTTGINTVRIYNPVKQGYDQDPDGVFVRRWLPELANVPTRFIHEPWKWDRAGSILDKHYPMPVVDHLSAARDARQKIWAVRRGDQFRDTAATIQTRHGSRKRGLPMMGRKSLGNPRKQQHCGQLSLSFEPDSTHENT